MNAKPKRAHIYKRQPGRYQFKIIYVDGSVRYFTKTCDPETAKKLHDKIKNRIALGTFDLDDFFYSGEKKYSCKKLTREYLSSREGLMKTGRLSKNTLDKDYYSAILWTDHFGRSKSITEITEKTVNDFIIKLKTKKKTIYGGNYTASSINGYLKHLSGFFSYAVKNGYMKSNPILAVNKISDTQQKRIYTNDEIATLRDILSKGPRWQLDIFNLALWTGGRVQELLNLKEADFTAKNFDKLGTKNF